MKIKTYKAISNNELLYGFQPFDLAFILIISFSIGFYVHMFVGFLIFIILAILLKKFAKRKENYFKNLFMYTFTPKKFSVKKEKKIKPYMEILNATNKT